MTTKLYLIRHAEAEGNLFRVAHGQYNSNITPRGYRQLAYLRRRFQEVHLDAVYGSDLTRAHTTASALYVPRGMDFHPAPLLREICLGVWEQQSWAELQRWDRQMYIDFNKRPDLWHAEGAETFAQVRDRMLEGVRRIAAENPGKTIAATSHGAALRTLLGTLQGLSLAEIGQTPHGDNTAVSLLEIEDGDIKLVFRDDNSHVPPSVSTFRRQSWHKDDAATEPGLWFRAAREDGEARVVEGLMEEEVVGRLSVRPEGDMLRIDGYEIIPALRGQRYGVQLLGQAVQYARRIGRETLVLTCEESLSGYFALYGFEVTDRQGSDVEMRMDLRPVIRDIPEIESFEGQEAHRT